MKTELTTLRSFERIAHSHGFGTLLVGALLVIFYLGGHGALYNAYRVAGVDVPSAVQAS
jgi:hypothetical protein